MRLKPPNAKTTSMLFFIHDRGFELGRVLSLVLGSRTLEQFQQHSPRTPGTQARRRGESHI